MRTCPLCNSEHDDQRLVCPTDGEFLVYQGRPCPESGQVLSDRYRLGNLLGEGGMGRVYEARRVSDERLVAVKLLKVELSGSSEASRTIEKRLEVEAEAGLSLTHPGIVRVYEFHREAGGPNYLVMERLFGGTFEELRRAGKLGSPEHVVDLLRQVSEVLATAHERGIVHRDLKPSNLFLHRDPDGTQVVKVLDFGIAKILDREGDRLTSTGEFLGTLLYMAPELTSGQPVTTAADIYSLGVILFEALAGRVPFTGRNPLELIRHHAQMPAPSLATYRPEISDELDLLVNRCLAKRPDGRFCDAGELARALGAIHAVRSAGEAQSATKTFAMSASSWVGIVLDERYEIHEWVSLGRFGSDVYRASHLRTGASVAVRLWRTGPGVVRDCLLDAFRKESKAMGVRHPNVISIIDLGFNETCVYVVTELVESVSLRDLLARKGALSPAVASRLARGGAEGLGALHAQGIISGGLSPETIRIVQGEEGPERLLLSPFGITNLRQLSSLLPRARGIEESDRSVDYIAPEQVRGEEPTPSSDLFSLGLILVEMLGGRVQEKQFAPTRSTHEPREDLVEEVRQQPPILPTTVGPEWIALLEKATAEDPSRRYSSASELLAALPEG